MFATTNLANPANPINVGRKIMTEGNSSSTNIIIGAVILIVLLGVFYYITRKIS